MKTWRQSAVTAGLGLLSLMSCPCAAQLDDSFYRAQEFSVDAFASGSLGEEMIDHLSGNTVEHNGRLGAGAGANYFFTRYFGVGGDAYSENTAYHFIDSASGYLSARLPLGESGVAPYVFGGGGHQFDEVAQTLGLAGAGIEFRFARHAGFFIDARYIFAERTDNYAVGRAGLRINF